MNIAAGNPAFDASVVDHARKDFPLLDVTMTVGEALEHIRHEGVDEQRRVIGIIDANLFAEEILEAGESEDRYRSAQPVGPEFFEALGFRVEQIRGASPWRIFRFRFPWLLVTVTGGTLSAVLARFFEATLARSLVLAFFLTMVLALNESVSMQSMSVTIHALRSVSVTRRWLAAAFQREVATALLS